MEIKKERKQLQDLMEAKDNELKQLEIKALKAKEDYISETTKVFSSYTFTRSPMPPNTNYPMDFSHLNILSLSPSLVLYMFKVTNLTNAKANLEKEKRNFEKLVEGSSLKSKNLEMENEQLKIAFESEKNHLNDKVKKV